MSVGNEVLVAGPYLVTWNGAALGLIEGDASVPTLEHNVAAEDVANSSYYGKSCIDF